MLTGLDGVRGGDMLTGLDGVRGGGCVDRFGWRE